MSTKAILITPKGNRRRVPMADAYAVLRYGEGILVSRRPMVVEMYPRTPEYDEEARHMRGKITRGAPRGASGAFRWEGEERPAGQPARRWPALHRLSRGRKTRSFPHRNYYVDPNEREA